MCLLAAVISGFLVSQPSTVSLLICLFFLRSNTKEFWAESHQSCCVWFHWWGYFSKQNMWKIYQWGSSLSVPPYWMLKQFRYFIFINPNLECSESSKVIEYRTKVSEQPTSLLTAGSMCHPSWDHQPCKELWNYTTVMPWAGGSCEQWDESVVGGSRGLPT